MGGWVWGKEGGAEGAEGQTMGGRDRSKDRVGGTEIGWDEQIEEGKA